MKIDTEKLETILANAHKVTIISHLNPDGDALGSTTALHHYLKTCGIESRMVVPSEYAYTLRFLDAKGPDAIIIDKLQHEEAMKAMEQSDTIFCLDFNRLSRADALEPAIRESKAVKVLIDHHPEPEGDIFDLVYSRTDVSSASELLFWILMNLRKTSRDIGRLPKKAAESLYIGMMTDTNNFSNTVFPSTFEMASLLVKRGVNKDKLQEKVLSSYSFQRMRLMGHLLKDKMKFVPKHHAAYMILTNRAKRIYRFRQGDSEGFVNLALKAQRVKISALFTEDYEGKFIRVSLRSKGKIDVNEFAKAYFNGGGHVNAAGGRLYMPIDDVPQYFEEALDKFYRA